MRAAIQLVSLPSSSIHRLLPPSIVVLVSNSTPSMLLTQGALYRNAHTSLVSSLYFSMFSVSTHTHTGRQAVHESLQWRRWPGHTNPHYISNFSRRTSCVPILNFCSVCISLSSSFAHVAIFKLFTLYGTAHGSYRTQRVCVCMCVQCSRTCQSVFSIQLVHITWPDIAFNSPREYYVRKRQAKHSFV